MGRKREPIKFKSSMGPEEVIVQDLLKLLKAFNWYVMRTHGNMYQSGFPDLYATHKVYGPRWIEVKNPLAHCFTAAQIEHFPKLETNGTNIWILVGATLKEYEKLFKPPNYSEYFLGKLL